MKRPGCVELLILAVAMVCTAGTARAQEAAANLVPNPSFEDVSMSDSNLPSSWNYYCTGKQPMGKIDRTEKRSGQQSFGMSAFKTGNGGQGIVQEFFITEGERFDLEVYVREGDEPLKGTAFGQVVVEWRNGMNKEISRVTCSPFGSTLSRTRWEKIELKKIKAPKFAKKAVIGVHLYEGESGGTGTVLVDDVEFVKR